MDTLNTVKKKKKKVKKPGCYTASVDLKDAYNTVRIQKDNQKFLKFEFRVAFIKILASLMPFRVLQGLLQRYVSQFIQHCTIRAI